VRYAIRRVLPALCVFGALVMTGCAKQLSGAAEPGVDLKSMRTFYIVRDKETKVTTAMQKELAARGFTATMGPDSATPAFADCKVLAEDKWMWDLTMYPIEVKVSMVNPRTGALLASGRSYRTSLVRKSPDEMVKEVFDQIFGTAPVTK
jgi:hypothetical protein